MPAFLPQSSSTPPYSHLILNPALDSHIYRYFSTNISISTYHTKDVLFRLGMDDPCMVQALLLPADGSPITIVSCSIKERDDEDMVDSGMAEYFDPIPNLKPWFGDEYQQRAMAAFHVATEESNYADSIARAFVRSDNPAVHGQYCLYYTLSPNLPANETCKRLLGCTPSDRYFWRGNVLAVRFDGHLGMGHIFKNVEEAATEPVKEVLRRIHASKGLERVHKENESFSLQAEMEKLRERFPALAQATESGALERWRTAQPLSANDTEILKAIPSITAQHSDGSEELV